MLSIEKVQNEKEINSFVRFPWKVYETFPKWVPPIISDQKKFLNRDKNDFFQHSEAELFLAKDETGNVLGRIAAIKNQKHLDIYNDDTGFFGFFECIDNQEVAGALFDAAKNWLISKKMTTMRGPMSFTINDECGLLIDGFEFDPAIGMPYNPPYYEKLFERYGFTKAQDLFAFQFKPEFEPDNIREKVLKAAKRVEKEDFKLRPMGIPRNFEKDSFALQQVHEEAWEGNWGHIPMELDDFLKVAKEHKDLLDIKLNWVIEYKGEVAGILSAFPDLAPAIRSMNGRIFPFGFLKYIYNKRKIHKYRMVLFGILKKYRNLGLESLFLKKIDIEYPQTGYDEGEFSWILESNKKMLSTIERIGAKRYKTYRIFDKEI